MDTTTATHDITPDHAKSDNPRCAQCGTPVRKIVRKITRQSAPVVTWKHRNV
jgi:uncharacterized protein with PIN domain